MGQPVVLPKFELPGDKPHWAVRLAWVTAAVLLTSVIGLGSVIMHRRSLEAQVEAAKAETIAKAKAEADAKAAAIVAARRAAKEAELAERQAAIQAKQAAKQAEMVVAANTVPSAASQSQDGGHPTGKPNHVRHGRAPRANGKSMKLAAQSKSDAKSDSKSGKAGARSAAAKDDLIDEMLAKMKK